ncbi:MAG: hypothetical protein WDM87_16115 [Terracidiphilus sp.]
MTPTTQPPVLTGQAAFTDAAHEAPGIRRHLTAADLPEPMPEQSVDNGLPSFPAPKAPGQSRPKVSRSSSTPPASTTHA